MREDACHRARCGRSLSSGFGGPSPDRSTHFRNMHARWSLLPLALGLAWALETTRVGNLGPCPSSRFHCPTPSNSLSKCRTTGARLLVACEHGKGCMAFSTSSVAPNRCFEAFKLTLNQEYMISGKALSSLNRAPPLGSQPALRPDLCRSEDDASCL